MKYMYLRLRHVIVFGKVQLFFTTEHQIWEKRAKAKITHTYQKLYEFYPMSSSHLSLALVVSGRQRFVDTSLNILLNNVKCWL